MRVSELSIDTPRGVIPALLAMPPDAQWLYVFGHGAGAGMRHAFMESAARALDERGIATLRYEFPYMSAGSRRPDPTAVLESTVRAVVTYAAATYAAATHTVNAAPNAALNAANARPPLRIAAGGKSMGGRMTSRAQAAAPLPGVEALVFFGFPLHPPRTPSIDRAAHLSDVEIPMLFLQGTRDDLADLELLWSVTEPLGTRATLHVVDGADHGFAVLKRSGRTDDEVLEELADTTAGWLAGLG